MSTAVTNATAPPALDVVAIRAQFPVLAREVHGKPLVYLDNAATTLKPRAVIERLHRHYAAETANIHRGVHYLSEQATAAYERVRERAQRFLGAAEPAEIIFTSGTTDAINLVALGWGGANLSRGDEVVITHMEHHSNIVPWQMLAERTGAVLQVAPISDRGELEWESLLELLGPRTKLVAAAHVSNSLGTINPVAELVRAAHAVGARVLLDGAQAAAHLPLDVVELDVDFYCCSGHKLFGPTGTGVLYGKRELLEAMPPVRGGGDMIESVTFARTTYAGLPARLEAGTPHIAGVIGAGRSAGMDRKRRPGAHSAPRGTAAGGGHRRARRHRRGAHHRHGGAQVGDHLLHRWRRARPRRRHHRRPGRGRATYRPPLHPAGDGAGSAYPPPHERHSRCTTTAPTWRRWRARSPA